MRLTFAIFVAGALSSCRPDSSFSTSQVIFPSTSCDVPSPDADMVGSDRGVLVSFGCGGAVVLSWRSSGLQVTEEIGGLLWAPRVDAHDSWLAAAGARVDAGGAGWEIWRRGADGILRLVEEGQLEGEVVDVHLRGLDGDDGVRLLVLLSIDEGRELGMALSAVDVGRDGSVAESFGSRTYLGSELGLAPSYVEIRSRVALAATLDAHALLVSRQGEGVLIDCESGGVRWRSGERVVQWPPVVSESRGVIELALDQASSAGDLSLSFLVGRLGSPTRNALNLESDEGVLGLPVIVSLDPLVLWDAGSNAFLLREGSHDSLYRWLGRDEVESIRWGWSNGASVVGLGRARRGFLGGYLAAALVHVPLYETSDDDVR